MQHFVVSCLDFDAQSTLPNGVWEYLGVQALSDSILQTKADETSCGEKNAGEGGVWCIKLGKSGISEEVLRVTRLIQSM